MPQLACFNLGSAGTDPTYIDLSGTVPGANFAALAVRVVQSNATATELVVGGYDACDCYPAYPALLVFGSVAAGSAEFTTIGSIVVPNNNPSSGVTALSQTNALQPGAVLASTDKGVYKCAHFYMGRAPSTAVPNVKTHACVRELKLAAESLMYSVIQGCAETLPSLWRSISYPVGTITKPPPASATVTTTALDACALMTMLAGAVLLTELLMNCTECHDAVLPR